MFKSTKVRGFTLIELLVVIAIIGILASTVLASLSTSRQAARDARRLSDMKQLQVALELYRNANNGLYPSNPTNTEVANMNTGTANITPYINPIPLDPTYTTSNGYRYNDGAGRTSYTLLFKSENGRTNAAGTVINPGQWCSISMGVGEVSWNGISGDGESPVSGNFTPCF